MPVTDTASVLCCGVETQMVSPRLSRAERREARIELEDDVPARLAERLATAFAAHALRHLESIADLPSCACQGVELEVTAERAPCSTRLTRVHFLLRVTTAEAPRHVTIRYGRLCGTGAIRDAFDPACTACGEIIAGPARGAFATRSAR